MSSFKISRALLTLVRFSQKPTKIFQEQAHCENLPTNLSATLVSCIMLFSQKFFFYGRVKKSFTDSTIFEKCYCGANLMDKQVLSHFVFTLDVGGQTVRHQKTTTLTWLLIPSQDFNPTKDLSSWHVTSNVVSPSAVIVPSLQVICTVSPSGTMPSDGCGEEIVLLVGFKELMGQNSKTRCSEN